MPARSLTGTANVLPSRFLREISRELLPDVRPKVQVSRSASLGAPRSTRHGMIGAPAITLGANVQHPKVGGVVIEDEDSGAHARVQVQFDPARSRARRT
ncbi:hypothetical protein GW16_09705 [Xanthomonas arboricola pv. celebensis]|nr:hypothetical protein GW16_09705 [Xanthomonas arboricola pv. celebensis]